MSYKQEKLLWVDMEMTGLDPEEDRITEVAAIVTDMDFNELDSYESLVFQPQAKLERMKEGDFYDWSSGKKVIIGSVYDIAKENGLIDKIKHAPKEKQVEEEFAKFVDKNFEGAAVLAGNSIHQDRRFIRQWWPSVEEQLHYRMVDVSSFKIIYNAKYGIAFSTESSHRALDDIRDSIHELQYYLDKTTLEKQ